MKKIISQTKKQTGFTLIELIIVIAILGILMAALIALIDPVDKVNSANDSKVLSDLNELYSASQRYSADANGVAPASTAVLKTPVVAGVPQELKTIPVQPGGAAYGFNPVGTAPNYTDVTVCGLVKSKGQLAKAAIPANLAQDPSGRNGVVCAAGANCYAIISNGKVCYMQAACTATTVCP